MRSRHSVVSFPQGGQRPSQAGLTDGSTYQRLGRQPSISYQDIRIHWIRRILAYPRIFHILVLSNLILAFLLWRTTAIPLPTSLSELRSAGALILDRNNTLGSKSLAKQSCEVCVVDPTHQLCEYGLDIIRMSRSYEGSGFRVRRVMEKAWRGEPISIGVIGASISLGHGFPPNSGYLRWHDHLHEEFIQMFPNSNVTFHYGMVGAMNSDFFARCFKTLLPDSLDLYLVELDVNNEPADHSDRHSLAMKGDDDLYRALLNLPQQPAVVRASVVALMFNEMYRGALQSQIQSQYFDVPVIGMRNAMLAYFLLHSNDTERWFAHYESGQSDTRHISGLGHRMLGDMMKLYFKEQLCEVKRRTIAPVPLPRPNWPQTDILGYVPRMHIWRQFNDHTYLPPVTSFCTSAISKTHPMEPLALKGNWEIQKWHDKAGWVGSEIGSEISFHFEGTSVGAFIWRSAGVRGAPEPGKVIFIVDGNGEDQRLVDAFHEEAPPGSIWTELFSNLKPGSHTLTCIIIHDTSSSGHEFRILSIGGL